MTTVVADKFGRIMLPRILRNMTKSREFSLEANLEKKEIKLKPVPTWEEMRGFLKKKIDLNDLVRDRETQWH